MRRRSSLRRLAAASVGLLAFVAAVSAQTEVYFRNRADADNVNTRLSVNSPPPTGHLPVLFVHGHNPELFGSTEANAPHYKENWQNSSSPSVLQTLKLPENDWLDIEEYYIRFLDQGRSITEDAAEISDAIDLILHRHDSSYDYPHNPTQTTSVQVVIIAYSKGTISSRQYLKSLQTQVPGMPAPRAGFRPVSEFIAISPPNHGISSTVFAKSDKLSVKQMYNGLRPEVNLAAALFFQIPTSHCGDSYDTPEATDYIRKLNCRDINLNCHTMADIITIGANEYYPDEAPGSRADKDATTGVRNPPTAGTLYVTLFARDERDFVGGLEPSTDCPVADGRKLARNLAEDAVNIEVPQIEGGTEIVGSTPIIIHGNTVHTAEVICLALSAAVNHRSPLRQTCATTDGKPIIPRAAVMLTLDFSGSMLTPAPPHLTRAAALKQAVELFIQLWSELGGATDRLGVTYFRTNVEPWDLGGNRLPLLSAGSPAIIDNLRTGQEPSGLTAMGGGLQSSIDVLKPAEANTRIRRVILFTDGMQNVNPRVERNETTNQLEIARPSGSPTVLNTELGIPVDTIGIGAGGDFLLTLQNISNATGGRPMSTVDPSSDLRLFFVGELINALRGFSPQLVAYRYGAVAAKGSTEAFDIEDGVRKLVLKVSWKSGDSMDFSVAKDGIDVTKAGRFIDGAFYKIFVIDFPAKSGITARGNWQLRINGKAGTPYETAAIIDGGQISYDAVLDTKQPRAGDPLEFLVRLTAGGQSIGGSSVTVTLTSPTNTPGDIIARNQPKDLPAFEPGMTVAERRLLALAQDPNSLAALKPKQEKFVLKPNDKGEFRIQLHPQVAGIYKALFTLDGGNSRIGQFSRTLTTTTMVRFGNADAKASDIFVTECTDVGARRFVRLVVTPRDARGHYMGPGSPSAISLRISAGRMVGGVRDLGDGGYMFLLEMATADDPIINLEVGGGALFTRRLSRISRE